MTSINFCQRPIFCDFPSVSVQILTAPLQIGTRNMGFSAQFPAKKGQGFQHLNIHMAEVAGEIKPAAVPIVVCSTVATSCSPPLSFDFGGMLANSLVVFSLPPLVCCDLFMGLSLRRRAAVCTAGRTSGATSEKYRGFLSKLLRSCPKMRCVW